MALVLNNAQGELTPLEVGLHAISSGMTQREYSPFKETFSGLGLRLRADGSCRVRSSTKPVAFASPAKLSEPP
jgi:hypothetical protein